MVPMQLNQIPDCRPGLGSTLTHTVAESVLRSDHRPELHAQRLDDYNEQLLRPFPQFLNVERSTPAPATRLTTPAQLTVEHRNKQGLAVIFAYTFSKALDNVGEMTSVAGTYTGFQNLHCPRCDKSRSDQDETHVVRWSTSYELPFGAQKPFLNQGLCISPIVGGWAVSGIYTFDTGRPLTLSATNNSIRSTEEVFAPTPREFRPKLGGAGRSTRSAQSISTRQPSRSRPITPSAMQAVIWRTSTIPIHGI